MLELVAIDFEKARVLNGAGAISSGMLAPKMMLPESKDLGAQWAKNRSVIQTQITRIRELPEERIRAALSRTIDPSFLFNDLPHVDVDATCFALVERAKQLPRMVQEALDG